jgi:hypothetical protein
MCCFRRNGRARQFAVVAAFDALGWFALDIHIHVIVAR